MGRDVSERFKVLHLIFEPDRLQAVESAAATALYAGEFDKPLIVRSWAPKTVRHLPHLANKAREAGVAHRGPHAALELRSFLLRQRTSVVHCHDVRSLVTMGMLKRTGRMPPVVYSVYSPLWQPAPGRPLHELARKTLLRMTRASADAVTAPSTFARGVIISQGAFDPGKVWKVNYGVLPDFQAASPQTSGTEALLLPVDMARARRRTGYYYFLQAAQIVMRQVRHARFALVCEPDERGYVGEMAARFGLSDAVRTDSPDDFPGNVADASIAVLPTGDFQGIRPLLLAMAAGKAVVAPDLRGVREFLEQEETGLLVKPSDSQALAEALARLASSATARHKLAKSALLAVRRDFSARKIARSLYAVYSAIA